MPAIGAPFGLDYTLTAGALSAKGRGIGAGDIVERVDQLAFAATALPVHYKGISHNAASTDDTITRVAMKHANAMFRASIRRFYESPCDVKEQSMDMSYFRIVAVATALTCANCGGGKGAADKTKKVGSEESASQEEKPAMQNEEDESKTASADASTDESQDKSNMVEPEMDASQALPAAEPDMNQSEKETERKAADSKPVEQKDAEAETPEKPAEKKDEQQPMMAAKPEEPTPTKSDNGACDAGYTSVAGNCVCDLNGTFALRQRLDYQLNASLGTEAFDDTLDYWSLVTATYSSDGKLQLLLKACGNLAPDVCGTGVPPFLPGNEAYAQYVPSRVWDSATATTSAFELDLTNPIPKADFLTPAVAQLTGIELADPLGQFPSSHKEIEGDEALSGEAVNGAKWIDTDGDGQPALTVYSVPPGGLSEEEATGLPVSYGATSEKCPRSNPDGARFPYAYLPAPDGLQLSRMTKEYTAQRLMSEFHGVFESCDRVAGELSGPGGPIKAEAVFAGCVLGEGSNERTCSTTTLDTLTQAMGSLGGAHITGGRFTMVRIANDASCAQARAATFD